MSADGSVPGARPDALVRGLALVIGLALVVTGLALGVGSYRGSQQLRHAPHCGDPTRCIVSTPAAVIGKGIPGSGEWSTGVQTTRILVFTQAGSAPPTGAASGGATTTTPTTTSTGTFVAPTFDDHPAVPLALTRYALAVRRVDDGRLEMVDVSRRLYDAAHTGSAARLDVWRGHPVRVAVGPAAQNVHRPAAIATTAWLVGWAGCALLISAIAHLGTTGSRPTAGRTAAVTLVGWSLLVGILGYGVWSVLRPNFPQAWWISPLAVAALVAVARRWWPRPGRWSPRPGL